MVPHWFFLGARSALLAGVVEREEDRRPTEARAERERAVMRLGEAASAAFAAALLAPAEPGPRLRRAAERYRALMAGER